jgi:hypothetical protein
VSLPQRIKWRVKAAICYHVMLLSRNQRSVLILCMEGSTLTLQWYAS